MAISEAQRIDELKRRLSGLPGQLVVVSGPSAGAGKGKVIDGLKRIVDVPLWQSVSMTTRQRRSDDHIHHTYNFVTADEFEECEARGDMLEANGVTEGNRYGTPLQPIVDHLAKGDVVLLEIEIHGAKFVHEVHPAALCLFIKPTDGTPEDDLVELRRRLVGRGTNDAASVERRLQQAAGELELARKLGFYDEWVVNATGRSEDASRRILELIHERIDPA